MFSNYFEMSLRRRYFLNVAASEALKSPVRLKVGCVITLGNKIVAKGYNNYIHSPSPHITRHAEIDAITNLKNSYRGKDR